MTGMMEASNFIADHLFGNGQLERIAQAES